MKVILYKSFGKYELNSHNLLYSNLGWRQELRDLGTDIRVAQLCPGVVETEFSEVNLY